MATCLSCVRRMTARRMPLSNASISDHIDQGFPLLVPPLSSPIFKRNKNKIKWASKYNPTNASSLALEYMDAHYPRLYGPERWSMIRCALLSRQKYGMLVNPYLDSSKAHAVMIDVGAEDILPAARVKLSQLLRQDDRHERRIPPLGDIHAPSSDNEEDHGTKHQEVLKAQARMLGVAQEDMNETLDFFIPAKKIYYRGLGTDLHMEADMEKEEEMREAMKKSHKVSVEADASSSSLSGIAADFELAVSPRGAINTFPKPYHQLDRLGYYLFDAASLLPVVALDVQEGDTVADVCAAPGGKTLAILFAKKATKVVAIDKSFNRLERLKEVMHSYLPPAMLERDSEDNRINYYVRDVLTWKPGMQFDRVLADVPCSNDRLSVNEDDNNVFSVGRTREREALPEYQCQLLLRAYELCKPGGEVVYSTCTLSPSQNDGVIRRLFEMVKRVGAGSGQGSFPRPIIVDQNHLSSLFQAHFDFHQCTYGLQVVPSLQANFGPMYIAKLKKPI